MLLKKLRPYFDNKKPEQYLKEDFRQNLTDIDTALRSIEMQQFRGFIWEGTILSGATSSIPNKIAPIVPKYRIILRSDVSTIDDGVTSWDKDFVYLRNTGGSTATLKVLFCL